MLQLQKFDLADSWADIIATIDQDGGVIVENFLSPDLLQRLVTDLTPAAKAFAPGVDEGPQKKRFWGNETIRFTGLARRAPSFVEVIDHDLLHTWTEGEFENDYWMNTGQAMIVGPGSSAQTLHRDAGNWPLVMSMGSSAPEITLSAMLALSDFTVENGATQVVPGSHNWSDFQRRPRPNEITQAVMPAGAAMLYTGKTMHGAGANTSTDEWRFGVHISFVLGQLTPEEAHTVTVPWEAAKDFPERVKHMLGYASHRTQLADWAQIWTYDYRDVRNALDPPADGSYTSAGAKHLSSPL